MEIEPSRRRAIAAASTRRRAGTLSPVAAFGDELGLEDPVTLENPHVVDASKDLLAAVVGTGPMGRELRSTYESRKSDAYKQELGGVVLAAAERIRKGGVLVFFPSYAALEDCATAWRAGLLMAKLERNRTVVVEPRTSADFRAARDAFDGACGRGCAVLLAVCRGKASEGMDFADDRCRVVVLAL